MRVAWRHARSSLAPPEVEYLEAWDIIVIGDGPAALRASASAAKAGASTLMMSADSLGAGNNSALDGIAAPLKESTTKSYRDDTIRAGGFLCDQDIVSTRVSEATRQVDLLERWGVIFRRDADGILLGQKGCRPYFAKIGKFRRFNGSRDSTSTRRTVHEARGNSQRGSSSSTVSTHKRASPRIDRFGYDNWPTQFATIQVCDNRRRWI